MEHSDDELPTNQPPSPDLRKDESQRNPPAINIVPPALPASQSPSTDPQESRRNPPIIINVIPPSPVKSRATTSGSPQTTPGQSRAKRRATTDSSDDLTPKKSREAAPSTDGSPAARPSEETGSPAACALAESPQATQSEEHRQTISESVNEEALPAPHGTTPRAASPDVRSTVISAGGVTVALITGPRTRSQTMSQRQQAIPGPSGLSSSATRRTTRSQSFSPKKKARSQAMSQELQATPGPSGVSTATRRTKRSQSFSPRKLARSQPMSQELQAIPGPSGVSPATRPMTRSQSISPKKRARQQAMSDEPEAIPGPSGVRPATRSPTRSQSISPKKIGNKRRCAVESDSDEPWVPDEEEASSSTDSGNESPSPKKKRRKTPRSEDRSRSRSYDYHSCFERSALETTGSRVLSSRGMDDDRRPQTSSSSDDMSTPATNRARSTRTSSSRRRSTSASGSNVTGQRHTHSRDADETETTGTVPEPEERPGEVEPGDTEDTESAESVLGDEHRPTDADTEDVDETETTGTVPEPEERPADGDLGNADETETTEFVPEPDERPTDANIGDVDEMGTTETVPQPEETPMDVDTEDTDDMEMAETVPEPPLPMSGDESDDQVVPGRPPGSSAGDPQPSTSGISRADASGGSVDALVTPLSYLNLASGESCSDEEFCPDYVEEPSDENRPSDEVPNKTCPIAITCPRYSIFAMRRLYRSPAEDWFEFSRLVYDLGPEDLNRIVYSLLRIAHRMEPEPRYGRHGEIYQIWDTPVGRGLHEIFMRRPLFIVLLTHIFVNAFYDFNRNHSTFAIRFGIGNAAKLIWELANRCYFLKFCKIRARVYLEEATKTDDPQRLDRETELHIWSKVTIPRVRFFTQIPMTAGGSQNISVPESESSETSLSIGSSVGQRNVWVLEPTAEEVFRQKLFSDRMGGCPPHYGPDVIPGLLPAGFRYLEDDVSVTENELRRREPPRRPFFFQQRPYDPAHPSLALNRWCPCAVCSPDNNQRKSLLNTPDGHQLSCRQIQNDPWCYSPPVFRLTSGSLSEISGISHTGTEIIGPTNRTLSVITRIPHTDDPPIRPTQELRLGAPNSSSSTVPSIRPATDPHGNIPRIARSQVPIVEPAIEPSSGPPTVSIEDLELDGLPLMLLARYASQEARPRADKRKPEDINPEELLSEEPGQEQLTPKEPTPDEPRLELEPTPHDLKGKRSKYSKPKRSKPKTSSEAAPIPLLNVEEPMPEERRPREPRPEERRPEEPMPEEPQPEGQKPEQRKSHDLKGKKSKHSKSKRSQPKTSSQPSPASDLPRMEEPSLQLTNEPPVGISGGIRSVAGTSAGNSATPSVRGPLDRETSNLQDVNSYQMNEPMALIRTEQQDPEVTRRIHNTHVLRAILEAPPLHAGLPIAEPPNLTRYIRELFDNPNFCDAVQSVVPGIPPADFERSQPKNGTCSTVDSNAPAASNSSSPLGGIPPGSQNAHMDMDRQTLVPEVSAETVSISLLTPVFQMLTSDGWQTVALEYMTITFISATVNDPHKPALTSDEEQMITLEAPEARNSSHPTYIHPMADIPASQTSTSDVRQIVTPEATSWTSSEPTSIPPMANIPPNQTHSLNVRRIAASETTLWTPSTSTYVPPSDFNPSTPLSTIVGRRTVSEAVRATSTASSGSTPISPLELVRPNPILTGDGGTVMVAPEYLSGSSIPTTEIVPHDPTFTNVDTMRSASTDQITLEQSCDLAVQETSGVTEEPCPPSIDSGSPMEPSGDVERQRLTPEAKDELTHVCVGVLRLLVTKRRSSPEQDTSSRPDALVQPDQVEVAARSVPTSTGRVVVGNIRPTKLPNNLTIIETNDPGSSKETGIGDEEVELVSDPDLFGLRPRGHPDRELPGTSSNQFTNDCADFIDFGSDRPHEPTVFECESHLRPPIRDGDQMGLPRARAIPAEPNVVGEPNAVAEQDVVPEPNLAIQPYVAQYRNVLPEQNIGPEPDVVPEPNVVPELNVVPEPNVVPELNVVPEPNVVPGHVIPEPNVVPELNVVPEPNVVPELNVVPEPNVVPELNVVPEPNAPDRPNVEPEQQEVYQRLVGAQFGHIESAFGILQAISTNSIQIEDETLQAFIQSLLE